jgi:hypothetical protein
LKRSETSERRDLGSETAPTVHAGRCKRDEARCFFDSKQDRAWWQFFMVTGMETMKKELLPYAYGSREKNNVH